MKQIKERKGRCAGYYGSSIDIPFKCMLSPSRTNTCNKAEVHSCTRHITHERRLFDNQNNGCICVPEED